MSWTTVGSKAPVSETITGTKTPELFCIQCDRTHDTQANLLNCQTEICDHCQLPQIGNHKESTCIVATCTFCKKRGHDVSVCFQAPECKFCKKRGHMIGDCKALTDATCKICKQKGHTKNACPVWCERCEKYGHLSDECKTRFVCLHCQAKDLYHNHPMLNNEKNDIKCQVMVKDIKNGSYFCGRCGDADCWFTCKR